MEVSAGQAAFSKEGLRRCQYGGQIPGDEIQIPVVQAGGTTQEGHGLCSRLPQNSIPQSIPEVQNGFASLLAGKALYWVAEKPRRDAIFMVLVHHIAAGGQVVVDEHRQAAAAGIDIQPPIRLRVFHRFQLIGKIAVFQIVAAIPPEGEPHTLQQFRQLGKAHGRFLFRLGIHIKPGHKGD